MNNPFKDTNWNPDIPERRKFARSLIVGFPILGFVLAIAGRLSHGAWSAGPVWLGVIGCAAGVVLWLIPQIAKPFYIGWYAIACSIGIVISNLLLSAMFYLVFAPAGLVMRVLGRDPMARRLDRDAKTYWQDTEKISDPQRYLRQY